MARVGIVGIGHTRFGNSSEYDLGDVLAYAATDCLKDAGFLERRKEIGILRAIDRSYCLNNSIHHLIS